MKNVYEEKNILPMLLHQSDAFDDENFLYEFKYDGFRCIAYLKENSVELRSRNNKNLTKLFPELLNIYQCANHNCVLDGELVVFVDGKPNFQALQKRAFMFDEFKIKLIAKNINVEYVVFDILYLDDENLMNKKLIERKKIINQYLSDGNGLSISQFIAGKGIEMFNFAKSKNLEGVVAKKIDSKYISGKRSYDWLKIKAINEIDLEILGCKLGDNNKIKIIYLGLQSVDGKNNIICKICSGVNVEEQKIILQAFVKRYGIEMQKNLIDNSQFANIKTDNILWTKTPTLKASIQYLEKTESGNLRHPVWKNLIM